jgi:hypothetical protein
LFDSTEIGIRKSHPFTVTVSPESGFLLGFIKLNQQVCRTIYGFKDFRSSSDIQEFVLRQTLCHFFLKPLESSSSILISLKDSKTR